MNQAASAGSRKIAPSTLTRNMNDSSTPMSAWNLSGANAQVQTPMDMVKAVNTAAVPRWHMAR
ncbi:hypothetical protein D3C84_1222960 [compost metagenome]